MNITSKSHLNLQKLILLLCVLGVAITFVNLFYSTYHVQKELLINQTIESNRVYAKKMSDIADSFLADTLKQLEYSSLILKDKMATDSDLMVEVKRVKEQSDLFNSVVVVSADGVIAAIAPETISIKGVKLSQERELQSLNARVPLITDPFISPAGNYLISISLPIFDDQQHYLGYIAGNIYLEKMNFLTRLLGDHAYRDGSYLYIVDKNRTLISHPEKARIGEVIENNAAINLVSQGISGGRLVTNSQNIEMLTGYAPVNLSGWGGIVQRPKVRTLESLNQQMWNVVLTSLPIGIATLASIWFAATYIAKPLWQLSRLVNHFEDKEDAALELKKISPWYFEAQQLTATFIRTFSLMSDTIMQLHSDSLTDPMTQLFNRRRLEKELASIALAPYPLSFVFLDIDFFKKVNDRYGHDAGDQVLIEIAELMKAYWPDEASIYRLGGEEFLIILPHRSLVDSQDSAERLRRTIATHRFTQVGYLTVSMGISFWQEQSENSIEETIKRADIALYQAKKNGRNRVEAI
ncbi:sensor domain-containing diguanylate cyclase [Vibrio fujianensis]|uniref:sensor domain-containing diguanylate cyclase n=1 Tax=Vibrio fujianensis TaxID=1974215 RepID=UPI000C167E51|nr:sensor domain-containing diguanylate cyclase [Vibrio fujianensis]